MEQFFGFRNFRQFERSRDNSEDQRLIVGNQDGGGGVLGHSENRSMAANA